MADNSSSCQPCPLGSYKDIKDDPADYYMQKCKDCPDDRNFTLEMNSTSKDDCKPGMQCTCAWICVWVNTLLQIYRL